MRSRLHPILRSNCFRRKGETSFPGLGAHWLTPPFPFQASPGPWHRAHNTRCKAHWHRENFIPWLVVDQHGNRNPFRSAYVLCKTTPRSRKVTPALQHHPAWMRHRGKSLSAQLLLRSMEDVSFTTHKPHIWQWNHIQSLWIAKQEWNVFQRLVLFSFCSWNQE